MSLIFFNQCFVCGFRWSVLCISASCNHIKLRNTEKSCSGFTFWTSSLTSYNIIWFALFLNEGTSSGDLIGYTRLSYTVRFWAVKLSLLTINLQTLHSLLWHKNSPPHKKKVFVQNRLALVHLSPFSNMATSVFASLFTVRNKEYFCR